jgi:hypothetical protein
VSQEKEAFLDRWSRLKKEESAKEEAKPAEKKDEPLPVLPPAAELKPDSDFKPFMDPRVSPDLRRDALKKLFADPQFNVIDPFEPYSIDLTKEDPIPPEMLKTLEHARRMLFDEKEQAREQVAEQVKEQTQENLLPEAKDVAGKQDA